MTDDIGGVSAPRYLRAQDGSVMAAVSVGLPIVYPSS